MKQKVKSFRVKDFEQQVTERLKAKIDTLTIRKKKHDSAEDKQLRKLRDEKEKVSTEIDNVLKALTETTSAITMSYIEKKISELDTRKKQIETEIESVRRKQENKEVPSHLSNVMSKWEQMSFDDKRAVILLLIDKILVYDDQIEIVWNV